jgi:hypothetical protein
MVDPGRGILRSVLDEVGECAQRVHGIEPTDQYFAIRERGEQLVIADHASGLLHGPTDEIIDGVDFQLQRDAAAVQT